ncbi:transcriptional regulatory protein QseF [Anaerotignum neopropionicum]|uniref:HTH-type transcriptional regulatory protein TyrR n=1 Tax=Anaerotignum neopropionicum TaxID=36847 RepID=A0A136WEQ3_9FIRM|nr:sigma 54-interacting transcriptional regulator [Anaerotignum neopropionicum]KXL52961.1 transcriptional regulatory protein QseF [Anaerotignum neopropionicum]
MEIGLYEKLPEDLRSILLKELLQNPFMGINITDKNGKVLFVNKTHYKITGHPPELYIGQTMKQIADKGLISESATLITLKTKQTTNLSQISSHKNRYFQVTAIPVMDSSGEIKYVINYLIEVSDLVKLRNQLHDVNIHNQKLLNYNEHLRKKLNLSGELVYQSLIMQNVVEAAAKVAEHDVSVLITGPSGTGKEMIANLLHAHSNRYKAPFIKINCAAIPEQLLESELFGYEPGAFTGGNPKGKKGLMESADTGTLLLDEIGELPLSLQSKLLRVLQNHELRHIGGNKDINVDFRLITSTNADLKTMIQQKTFREDLYYRLNVIELKMPGLEERKEDIVLLINHFLNIYNTKHNTNKTYQKEALLYLTSCNYPGNVRELQNIVERTVVMSTGATITLADAQLAAGHLKPVFQENILADTLFTDIEHGKCLKKLVADYEKEILALCQKKYKSGAKMAEALQTDQSTISRKLSRYHILSDSD